MKKITLKQRQRTVSATLEEDDDLQEALIVVAGLLKALGYCFDGTLEIVSDDTEK